MIIRPIIWSCARDLRYDLDLFTKFSSFLSKLSLDDTRINPPLPSISIIWVLNPYHVISQCYTTEWPLGGRARLSTVIACLCVSEDHGNAVLLLTHKSSDYPFRISVFCFLVGVGGGFVLKARANFYWC